MELKYYIKDHGQGPEDAISITHSFKDLTLFDPDELAELCANYAWDHNDGWEWLRDGGVLSVIFDGEELGDFEITVDMEPVISARKKEAQNVLAHTGRTQKKWNR